MSFKVPPKVTSSPSSSVSFKPGDSVVLTSTKDYSYFVTPPSSLTGEIGKVNYLCTGSKSNCIVCDFPDFPFLHIHKSNLSLLSPSLPPASLQPAF